MPPPTYLKEPGGQSEHVLRSEERGGINAQFRRGRDGSQEMLGIKCLESSETSVKSGIQMWEC